MSDSIINIFENYLISLKVCSGENFNGIFDCDPSKAIVDCFAIIPMMESVVICHNNTGHSIINRVFYDLKEEWVKAFLDNDYTNYEKVVDLTESEKNKVNRDVDYSLLIFNSEFDSLTYVPLLRDGKPFCVLRIIGSHQEILKLVDLFQTCLEKSPFENHSPLMPTDFDLIPHVLGRWAGIHFGRNGHVKSQEVLLECCNSFFTKGHMMFFSRDFKNGTVSFEGAPSEETKQIMKGVSAPLGSPDYMFSIISSHGVSEYIESFPKDLKSEIGGRSNTWKFSPKYTELVDVLGADELSLFGIPLKVDDAILGVYICLVDKKSSEFSECYRFARSCISEMGRTIDKVANSQTSKFLIDYAKSTDFRIEKSSDVANLGMQLVQKFVDTLLFFGELTIGSREASLDFQKLSDDRLSDEANKIVERFIIKTNNESPSISLYYIENSQEGVPIGLMLVPIPAALPFVIYLSGPMALMKGRSLKSALTQLQAVLMLAFAEAELGGRFDMGNIREHLALWSRIHDLKNDFSRLHTPLDSLLSVSENGSHADLKEEVVSIYKKLTSLVREFEGDTDLILRRSTIKKPQRINLYKFFNDTWRSSISATDGDEKPVGGKYVGDTALEIYVSQMEFSMVIKNVFSNIFKHFSRCGKSGNVNVIVDLAHQGTMVTIKISDDIYEVNSLKRVKKILEETDSQHTLKRFIFPVVKRNLHGEIWAEEEPENRAVCMCLQIPVEAKSK